MDKKHMKKNDGLLDGQKKYMKNKWMAEWIEEKNENIAGWLDGQEKIEGWLEWIIKNVWIERKKWMDG